MHLSPQQIATARGHTYTLFGRLYLEGITAESLPILQTIPELAAVLPETINLDDLAAEHYRLFGLNLFPYESIFLDPNGVVGGQTAEQVTLCYHLAGYTITTADTSPDHIGQELGFLGFLCSAESQAWEHNQEAVAHRMRRWQKDFLYHHLLNWFPPWWIALRRQAVPFYDALGELTAELLAHHTAEFEPEYDEPLPFVLPSPPLLLENDKTGLRDVVRYILTPPYSGLFLSRGEIERLAQQQNLPRGFGGREEILHTVAQTAVQYEAFAGLVVALQQIISEWQRAYAQMADSWPIWRGRTAVWQERLTSTHHLTSELLTHAPPA